MTWELAAAILISPLPWFTWLLSMQINKKNDDSDWAPIGVASLRVVSVLLLLLDLTIAQTWSRDYGASQEIQDLFTTPLLIITPLTWVAVSLIVLWMIVKSVMILRFRRLNGKNASRNKRRPQFL